MIETERLILRPWREDDIAPFHATSKDEEVMRYLGPLATAVQAQDVYERMAERRAENGFCFWAIEHRAAATFIGFCGLLPAKPPIKGEIEIGWRLARGTWGQGYAVEAASACLDWAWTNLDVSTIAAITVPANIRSRGLMERLGMARVVDGDFEHPDLPPGDPLRHHVLYRIDRPHDH